jgi:Fic family protein
MSDAPYIPRTLPLDSIDWEQHIPEMYKANSAISTYNGILMSISNPHVLLSPLLFREAWLSSKIEGTKVSLEEVLRYGADARGLTPEERNDAKEVMNYRLAMLTAIKERKERPIGINTIRTLHRVLMKGVRGQDKQPGEIRRTQVYVVGRRGAYFTPPEPHNLMDALTNWEDYLNQDERNPLVQLAILKAQFELIHPFSDGNGRIGRMLVPLILFEKKVLKSPDFYISAYLDKNRDAYLDRLEAISEKDDWGGWISFFLYSIGEQAEENCRKALDIINLHREMERTIPDITHSQYTPHIIKAIFSSPIFNSRQFVSTSKIPRPTAIGLLKKLEEREVLIVLQASQGRRPAYYGFPKLMAITEIPEE